MLRPSVCSFLLAALCCAPLLAKEAEKHPLPIVRVVLFTSGVAFVEHRGEVEGDQSIDFKFHVDDINDLLKSMVVQDLGGGTVETVTYAPQEPLSVQLGELRINPSQVRSLGDLLARLRGERVELEVAPKPLTGTIIAIERQRVQTEQQVSEQEVLLLKSTTGLRNVFLSDITSVKLLDEALDSDLQRALELLASGGKSEKKQVSLRLRGKGKRQVRVGYIQEFPVWKTSYRLVVEADKPALLQGWAIVENTTDHDWDGVQVSLVSGRPVSFVMDLYEPLFLSRPSVVPQLFAGLHPKIHPQAMEDAERAFQRAARGGGFGGFGGGIGGGGFGGGFGGGGGGDPFDAAPGQPIDPQPSVKVAAQGANVGTFFRYAIEHPVTLARQRSAMLAIVNESVQTKRKAVFNPATDPQHPMTGLELTNSTKLHLMQGPITVFDGGEYAGDAQIEDLAPQTKRLITYALDLNTEIIADQPVEAQDNAASIVIRDGYVKSTTQQQRQRTYTVKNSNADAREVLIEQPMDELWTLAGPEKATEQTRDHYRFALEAPPGKRVTLDVSERRTLTKQIEVATRSPFGAIKAADVDREAAYLLAQTAKEISPALREALELWREKHQAVLKVDRQLDEAKARVEEIDHEQNRIRANLEKLPKESELYRRYLTTLNAHEDELIRLREQRAKLLSLLALQKQDLDNYLVDLRVE